MNIILYCREVSAIADAMTWIHFFGNSKTGRMIFVQDVGKPTSYLEVLWLLAISLLSSLSTRYSLFTALILIRHCEHDYAYQVATILFTILSNTCELLVEVEPSNWHWTSSSPQRSRNISTKKL